MFGQRLNNTRWLAAAAFVLTLGAGFFTAGIAAAGTAPHSHLKGQKGGGGTTQPPLVYHHGNVLSSSTTYAIFWGPTNQFPSDAETDLPLLLAGFSNSSYLAIANQYMIAPATTATTTYGGKFSDTTTAPPAHAPAVSTIGNEVSSVLSANRLSVNQNAIYVVYTSNFPHLSFCAWHAAAVINGVQTQIAYVPNASGVSGCDPGNLFGSTVKEGTRSMADSTAHEFMESTTDPEPLTGWADKNGQEIGDKCNFVYSAPVQLTNGTSWQIQEEWSNAIGGCQQQ
jgi:hypothetical protein